MLPSVGMYCPMVFYTPVLFFVSMVFFYDNEQIELIVKQMAIDQLLDQ